MTTDTALRVTGILLGGFLSLIFVGYMVLSFSEGKGRSGVSVPQRFAGIFTLILGVIMLAAWSYLMVTGWTSFLSQAAALSIHALAELLTALALILAGVAMVRGWARGPALFVTANGLFLVSTLFALMAYGNTGHPLLMNGITILLLIVSTYVIGLVYAWEHFVLHLDEKESQDKPEAA